MYLWTVMHKQTEIKVKFDKGHLSPLIKKKKNKYPGDLN